MPIDKIYVLCHGSKAADSEIVPKHSIKRIDTRSSKISIKTPMSVIRNVITDGKHPSNWYDLYHDVNIFACSDAVRVILDFIRKDKKDDDSLKTLFINHKFDLLCSELFRAASKTCDINNTLLDLGKKKIIYDEKRWFIYR